VRASNAGHLLWSGICAPERAARVADMLFAPTSFTGWGIRTLDSTASRFNPISYHNGSIWPHDNAILAAGFARYGMKHACTRLLEAMFEASHHFELGRMPEGPTLYPVACAPQAWAAGAVFMLLQACIGLELDAPHRRVVITKPHLPPCIEHLAIRSLRVADAVIDLAFHRRTDDVSVQLERRHGVVEVVVLK
jgi:glycogen debranching enzyme